MIIREIYRIVRVLGRLVIPMLCVLVSLPAGAADFGKPGEPIHLVVGYPCCYTEVWSASVLRGKELWKKYLPKGSTVTFQSGLQGSTITTNMLAGKAQIGYVGDLPAISAVSKSKIADLRLVAVTGVAYDQCNILLVRENAPEFKSTEDAIKWLGGKRFAVPKGTCSDIFSKAVFKKIGVQPEQYINQNVEVITSSFRAQKIDGAAIWEPIASRLINEKLARRVASGVSYGLRDSSYLLMNAQLIEDRPDVVSAWLNAELDAQLYLANPKNSNDVANMVMSQTTGFKKKEIWDALYRTYPEDEGGTKTRIVLPFGFTPTVMELLHNGTSFLHSIKVISSGELRKDAIMPAFAQEVLSKRGLASPVGEVPALPEQDFVAN